MGNNSKAFKEAYKKAKVGADADKAVKLLGKREIINLYNALVTVKAYMGIDMRQEFYLGILAHLND